MRALIFGAGSMGTALGAFITAAGGDIELVSRNAAHIDAISGRGARITGGAEFKVALNAYTPDKMTGRYDVIFLMTKQRGNAETLNFLLDYLAEDGVICTMQNGLPESYVAQIAGEKRCLGCAVSWGAETLESGVIRLTSDRNKMTFSLGSPYGENPKISAVKSILSLAGYVETPSNFIGARWAKLAINSAFSSLSAVTGLTFGEVASKNPYKKFALGLLNEAFAAASADGVKIESIQGHDIVKIYGCKGGLKRVFASALLPLAMKNHKDIVSGMYRDLSAGRPCDIDFINGAVARTAERHNVPVPLNLKVITLAHSIERGETEISPANIAFL